jgi:DNA-binding response OmpR family regulator
LAKGKVLIVDDELYIIHILDFTLGLEGYDVVTALNGQQAIEAATKERPDLAIIDVGMQPMDGYDVCAALKLNPATERIPVILMSPTGSIISRQMAVEAGAQDCIDKPFSPRKLVECVNDYFRSSPTG